MSDVIAAILLTCSFIAGFGSLATGAFFTRSSLPLPLTGLVAAILVLILSDGSFVRVTAGLACVVCGFIAAATWAAGPDS